MGKKKLLYYTIWRDGYEREWTSANGWQHWTNHEDSHRLSTALKIGRRMGIGAEVTKVSMTRSGKKKYKTRVYKGD